MTPFPSWWPFKNDKAASSPASTLRREDAEAPATLWVEAFSLGFEKAWDVMWPLLADGLQRAKSSLEQQAIDQTLQRLEPMILERAQRLQAYRPKDTSLLLAKQEEFRKKRASAKGHEEQAKYDHYLEALTWILDANGVYSNQSTT